jgi:hypothetical protein
VKGENLSPRCCMNSVREFNCRIAPIGVQPIGEGQKSACRKLHQIGNGKRRCVYESNVESVLFASIHLDQKSPSRRLRGDDTPYKKGLGVSRQLDADQPKLQYCPSLTRQPKALRGSRFRLLFAKCRGRKLLHTDGQTPLPLSGP